LNKSILDEVFAPYAVDYAGREHPKLGKQAGRIIVISYYQPLGGLAGELRLVGVTFK
jgi:hypothetical protein